MTPRPSAGRATSRPPRAVGRGDFSRLGDCFDGEEAIGRPRESVRNMHLEDDIADILESARGLSKRVTALRRYARRVSPTWWAESGWWAEYTIAFADELLAPGRFFDRWFRKLGQRVDGTSALGLGRE